MKKWKYRKLVFLVLCLSLLLPSFTVWGETDDKPKLRAEAAVVMDMDSGDLVYEKDIKRMQYPGGLTKIMTVLLLAENYNLAERVSFSEILYDLGEGSLKLGLQPGEEITLYDAACAIILGSANDVSNGVAEYVAGSKDAFAGMMNNRAKELGCVNTHFSNPHGLYSEDHYTCAYDMALIARAAYENETFRKICGLTEYDIPATNLTDSPRHLVNYHQMRQYGSDYYQEWCEGGKVSYTSQSLNVMVTFGSKGGKHLVSVVMGVDDAEEAYEETARLFTYGFEDSSAHGEKTTEKATSKETEKRQIPAVNEREESPVQTEEDTGEKLQMASGTDAVIELLTGYVSDWKNTISEYVANHFKVVFIAGCFILFLVFLLIVIMLFRCITDFRIRKKRKKAEKIWREKEAQIEIMTLEELEADLRRRKTTDRGHEETDPADEDSPENRDERSFRR